jgi:DNA repair protein RadC
MSQQTAQLEIKVNAYQLLMVKDSGISKKAGRVMAKECTEPKAVAEAVRLIFENADREIFGVLALNTRNRIIGFNIVSMGDLDSSIVHPREVFKFAVLSTASSVILFHNHPSGDLTPSSEDINLTKRLVEAGELMGIPVLDHIILAEEGRYLSMKSRNYI